MAGLTEEHSRVWPVQSPNSTPPSPQSGLKGHCVSGKIVAGYNPLLKVTIFQRHLTHTHTQIETGEGGKNWGPSCIVYCACEIYVLWSPAVNTHCFSIKVRINPLSPFRLQICLFGQANGADGALLLSPVPAYLSSSSYVLLGGAVGGWRGAGTGSQRYPNCFLSLHQHLDPRASVCAEAET